MDVPERVESPEELLDRIERTAAGPSAEQLTPLEALIEKVRVEAHETLRYIGTVVWHAAIGTVVGARKGGDKYRRELRDRQRAWTDFEDYVNHPQQHGR